jgi:hypothetical protein
VLDEVIFQHLLELSDGALKMGDGQKLMEATDLVKRNVNPGGGGHSHKKHHKKHHKNFKRKQ